MLYSNRVGVGAAEFQLRSNSSSNYRPRSRRPTFCPSFQITLPLTETQKAIYTKGKGFQIYFLIPTLAQGLCEDYRL